MTALETVFPASFAQRRLWFLQAMDPDRTAYNLVHITDLRHPPDAAALGRALDDLVARHEPLRTRFAWEGGDPVQIVAEDGRLPLSVEDLRDLSHEDAEHQAAHRIEALVAEPFDLAHGELARAFLALIGPDSAVLALVVHHILVDGRSMRILLAELDTLYQARAQGRAPLLPEAPVQYGDFAVWQRLMLDERRLERLERYWRDRLDGLEELWLPGPARRSTASAQAPALEFTLPASLVLRLRALAAGAGTTMFATLLTGWVLVLGRFTGRDDVPVGIPVSGRPRPELQQVVGPFVNSVVMRADLSGEPTFEELLRRVTAALADDLTHQDLPFEVLVERLRWPRSASRNPIFQVMFQLQAWEGTPGRDPSTNVGGPGRSRVEPDAPVSQLDLSCIQAETALGTVEGGIVYDPAAVDGAFAAALAAGYPAVLEEAVARSGEPVSRLQVLDDEGARAVREAGEGDRRRWRRDRLEHALLRSMGAHPGRTAIVDGTSHVTFGELSSAAETLGAQLVALGAGPGRVVAVALPARADAIVGIVAALLAGAAYTYVDLALPAPRRQLVLADCDAAVVVVAPGDEELAAGRPVVTIPATPTRPGRAPGAGRLRGGRAAPSSDDPAYVIYTSGSTGGPKGVVVPRAALVNHMWWMLKEFPLGARDRVLQRTPLTFDASVWEVLAPLLAGCTLVVGPGGPGVDPAALAETIRAHRVTVLQAVPSLLRAFVSSGHLAGCTTLRRIFSGGEPLQPDLCDAVLDASSAQLWNLYGPTETTIDATYHRCDRDAAVTGASVPIGRPVANTSVHVLDAHGGLLPPGVPGEIYVGGAAVGSGYLGHPDLTAERFVEHPVLGRTFRTGDRGRLLADGTLEFLGRLDDQVKVRGFRVEPGEVEAVLRRHPDVADAAVVLQEHGQSDHRLVAFVVPAAIREPVLDLADRLSDALRGELPAHLVPSAVVTVDRLPRTRHGKLDRRALSERRIAVGAGGATPQGELERIVCAAFGEVLGMPVTDVDADFFHLGGHSLLVLPLRQNLARATSRRVDVVDLFEHPTPRRLAAAIGARTVVPQEGK